MKTIKMSKMLIAAVQNSVGRSFWGQTKMAFKSAGYVVRSVLAGPFQLSMFNMYDVECYDKDGNLKWREVVPNLVVNAGLDDVLDNYF